NSFKDAYDQIKASVLKSKSVNGDETTWKLKGKRQYIWIAAPPPQAVLLLQHLLLKKSMR
ncbi:MAG: Transposase family, partial [Chlamydiales bacterium]|nr:Transposase family [Chlamydiales bacterium]